MSRSLRKGPYIQEALEKRILAMNEGGKKKEVVTGAYAWMAVFLAAAMIFELFLIDWSDAKTDYGMFMAILGLPGIVSVLSGGVPAALVIRRERRKQKTRETTRVRPSRRDG